jgi:hypothetical protein
VSIPMHGSLVWYPSGGNAVDRSVGRFNARFEATGAVITARAPALISPSLGVFSALVTRATPHKRR